MRLCTGFVVLSLVAYAFACVVYDMDDWLKAVDDQRNSAAPPYNCSGEWRELPYVRRAPISLAESWVKLGQYLEALDRLPSKDWDKLPYTLREIPPRQSTIGMPAHCTINCTTTAIDFVGMQECESFRMPTKLDITLVGTCDSGWLRMPPAIHVVMHGPATIRGGALRLLFGTAAQSLHLDSLVFDGAGSHETLFDNYYTGIPNVTITNSAFFNWTGSSVLRFNAVQGTRNARIQNVTMQDIVGSMVEINDLRSFRFEDVSCENCAHMAKSCASIQMEQLSDTLIIHNVSCNRPSEHACNCGL